jgi:two-component system LytT family sensor kinase
MKQFFKYIFPAILGLLTYFTIRLLQDSETGYRFWYRPWSLNLLETSMAVVMGYISVYLVKRVCRYTDSHSTSRTPDTGVILREFIFIALCNTLLVNLIFTPMAAFTSDGLSLGDFVNINIVPLLYVMIYYGVIRAGIYLNAYVQHQLLVEKLTNDQLETELKFLKAQYHPHFLFNALNTIYFQVDDDIPGAKKSVELLSELLRYQLYDNQHTVAVKQELEHLQNFIELQQVRTSKKNDTNSSV